MFLDANLGLIDTGAETAVMSISTLAKYFLEHLKPLGLKFKAVGNEPQELSGIGGKAKVCFQAHIPMALGRIPGIVPTAITAQCTPTLLPNPLIRVLRGLIDQDTCLVTWRVHPNAKSELVTTKPSEHIAVQITEGLEGFKQECPHAGDFEYDVDSERWLSKQVHAVFFGHKEAATR